MLYVIALGGNALLQRGQALEAENLYKNALEATTHIAKLAKNHGIVIVHGNGPQIGLLALQSAAYTKVKPYPFDILGAESQGMIGYVLQQGLKNALPERNTVTLLTQVLVDQDDKAFQYPSKPIGPTYSAEESQQLQLEHPEWCFKPDGKYFRRVVPSPKPQAIEELTLIQTLLGKHTIVIAAGGGGIPCIKKNNQLVGVEAVIDKDMTASLLAQTLQADGFIILTDVDGVYDDWDTNHQKLIPKISVDELNQREFAAGSMQPKITAACSFTTNTKRPAMIGNLSKLDEIIAGASGTMIQ